jgi:cell wall assembly regulator SMI1
MTLQITNSQLPVDDATILAFESKFNIKLPDEYRRFLLSHNGGNPSPKKIITQDKKIESMVSTFFPLSDFTEDNLVNEFEGLTQARQIPPNFISIAMDPAENRIVLSIYGDDVGKVYYWSWDEEPKKPTCSYKYLRLIANNFDDFLSSLK